MDLLYDWAPAILIVGLGIAALGAGVAARAVLLTRSQADVLAGTLGKPNEAQGRDPKAKQGHRLGTWAARSRINCPGRGHHYRGVGVYG